MKKFILLISVFVMSCQILIAQSINPPTELEAENENPFYVKVKWRDNSNNEDGFYVERATNLDSSDWEVLGGVPANQIVLTDYWLTLNKKYYYRAYAYNSSGWSGYSNIDSVIAIGDTTNIPAAPSNLRITDVTMSSITISWDDNSYNELGFIIARKKPGDVAYEYIDTVGTDVLSYQELGLNPDNIYYYKICSYSNYGTSDFSNTVSGTTKSSTIIVNTSSAEADGYFLSNNYPNPFNPVTTIKFGIPAGAFVSLKVYNSTGSEVETLLSDRLSAGTYSVNWNAQGFSSGTYFYRISVSLSNASDNFKANKFSDVKKMILIK